MYHYHGTSADNLESILSLGLNAYQNGEQLWSVSDNHQYFWDPSELAEADGENYLEEPSMWMDRAKQIAFESADIALINAEDKRRVVLVFDLGGIETEKDCSCQNMDGAVRTEEIIDSKRIVGYYIDKQDMTLFTPYIWKNISGMDFLNIEPDDEMISIMAGSVNDESCQVHELMGDLQEEAIFYKKDLSLSEFVAEY